MGTSEPGPRPKAVPGIAAVGETRHISADLPEGKPRGSSGAEDTMPADSGPADGWIVAAEPPPAAPPPEPRPSGRIDRYVFGPELGRGGMGRVVEATDSRLGRKVAVKEALPRGLDLKHRFEREVRLTARLEHPSIVPLYDAGVTAEGNPFYVMRKVSGQPLDKLIADAGSLDTRLTLVPHLLAAIDAIAHAHRRRVVHRDMKPANVLVGEHGEAVVIDWGLAKALDDDDDDDDPVDTQIDPSLAPSDAVETQIGAVFGTPGFMAPEQARGESLDARSDVYALGATMYQLLSGQPPHQGTSATEVIDRALAEAPQPLRKLVGGVPPELVAIVDKALAFDRGARYPDAGALAEDVRRFLAGQLVAAHRYTARQRIGRFLRRHRAVVAVGTLAALALGLGGAISVRGIVIERDKAMRAEARAVEDRRAAEIARDREADRADELLITQARALVDSNPTGAIAALKLVAPTSKRWRAARMVAMSASAHGAAWGYPGHGIITSTLAIAPDGKRLLTAGESDGFRIHDLDRHEQVLAVDFAERIDACWIANGTAVLVAPRSGGLVMFDADLGTRTAVDWPTGLRAKTLAPTATGERVVIADETGGLAVLDAATGVTTRVPIDLVVDGAWVAPDGGWILATGDAGTRLVRPDGKVLWRAATELGFVGIAPSGRRAAVTIDRGVRIVEVAAGRATARVIAQPGAMIDQPSSLVFVGDQLYVYRFNGHLDRVGPDGVVHQVLQTASMAMMGTEARGEIAAYSGMEGRVVMQTDVGTLTLRAPAEVQLKRITGRPNSRYLASATQDLVIVWDLDRVTPTNLSTTNISNVLWRDDDTLVFTPTTEPLRMIDVRSGAVTTIDAGVDAPAMLPDVQIDGDGRMLVNLLPVGPALVRRGATRVEPIGDGAPAVLALLTGDRFAYAVDGKVVVGTKREDRRVVLSLPVPVLAVVPAGDGLVVMTSAEIIRLDGGAREIARLRLPEPPGGGVAIDADGLVVVALAQRVARWNGARIDDVAAFDAPVHTLRRTPAGILASTINGDHYLIGAGAQVRRVLARTASSPFVSTQDAYSATQLADGSLVVVDLLSLERTVLPASMFTRNPVVSPGGRRLAFNNGSRIGLWSLDAPLDPDAWIAWLDTLTNARPSTAPDVVWPWQVP